MASLNTARQDVVTLYGHRLRLRVCGLYREADRLLMVRHRGITKTDTFWSPPGGGGAVWRNHARSPRARV